ncbi:MAG: DUF4834 family protein [Bacteroidetes bacterium]|nr:DUF4834 family protein [Bacteroidota bacterium]MDA1119574.1 DUF4834 family protein [Bacteroidota bacterium]
MFKFLLILFLISYIVYKVGGFIFKVLYSGFSEAQRQGNFNSQHKAQKRKAPGSNLDIEHIPDKNKKDQKFKDGDYVDYEEVE